MNFVSTGVKEVTRRLRRQQNRLALANARKAVERAESQLGRVAWRELAEDDSNRPAFDELRRLDAEVAAAEVRIAELETQMREQEAAREAARAEHQALVASLDEKRGPVRERLRANQVLLAERRKALHGHNVRRAALEAEQTALAKSIERQKRSRLSDPQREERLQQSIERFTTIPTLLAEMDAVRPAMVEPMVAAEEETSVLRATIASFAQQAQAAQEALTTREREIALTLGGLLKEIAATRRQVARTEEQKETPFLLIGRRLAERDDPPAGAKSEFKAARRTRLNHEKMVATEVRLLRDSHNANRQDLRVFRFVLITGAVLVTLFVPLLLHAPSRRDWLPSTTQAIVTLDISSFTEADFTRALQTREPDAWQRVWTGLVQKVAEVPEIDVHRQVSRITHALAPSPDNGPPVDYLLVEMRAWVDVDELVRHKLCPPTAGFVSRLVNGLPIYEKAGLAIAQVGPSTLALGPGSSVEDLIRVRLGLQADLKSDASFFNEFQRLETEKTFRLVTQRPTGLTYLTDPLLNAQVLIDCKALGLTLDLHEPVSAVVLINTTSYAANERVAKMLQSNPDQVLQLQGAGPNLFISPPSIQIRDQQIEWSFKMTEPAAREFLQRVSNLGLSGADKKVARAGE